MRSAGATPTVARHANLDSGQTPEAPDPSRSEPFEPRKGPSGAAVRGSCPGRGDAHRARACTARAANLAAMPSREGWSDRVGIRTPRSFGSGRPDPRPVAPIFGWERAGRAPTAARPMSERPDAGPIWAWHPAALGQWLMARARELAPAEGGAELRCSNPVFRVKCRAGADHGRERGAPVRGRDLEGEPSPGRIGPRHTGNGAVGSRTRRRSKASKSRAVGVDVHGWLTGNGRLHGASVSRRRNGKGATATVTWCGCRRGTSFEGYRTTLRGACVRSGATSVVTGRGARNAVNPRIGSGMQQARKPVSGGSRRGGAKPRGRNRTDEGGTSFAEAQRARCAGVDAHR
jgi:hypothetical protein